jgi:hypothetical protein
MPGVQLAFTYIDENLPDDCEAAATVRLADVTKTGAIDVPSACVDSRRSLSTLVSIIDALDKTCAQNNDCLAFGEDPRDNCSRPRFTSDATFRPYQVRHDRYLRIIAAECEANTASCDEDAPGEPACVDGRCQRRE